MTHVNPTDANGVNVPPEPAAVEAAPLPVSPAQAAAAPGRNPVVWLGALLVICVLATVLLWQKVSNIQEQLAMQSADAQGKSQEAQALSKQALAMAQETVTRVAVLDARLSEVALQRSQLDELMQSLSRSRDENLVVDIEAALRLAQQQSELTGTVEPLLAALKSADQRVARAAQPRLALLQRALARDIERVKSAAVSDTPSMLVKLDELVRLADELPLANAVMPLLKMAEKPQAAASKPLDQWQQALQQVLGEARNLVRVSRIEAPEAALLSPEQSFFVRENLKLKLLNARLGLLSRQVDAARADLGVAQDSLSKYFDERARSTRVAVTLLQQVQLQMRQLKIPRVDDTLAVLATAAAGR
ncbi:uroporphyrinogen-III C-methyltransferase [Rhodoferax sp. U11-2br]|uniref:uroporphyrinogen-III C-methyltransferase n=1 Tax=Rhodoferax sp. U11-2br TaxID=2838878 RepID=UPI001BE4EFCE|nr:uroporphyrinogen-III C-methyltransferase [Rhodoferax sp. U11-2br]MBT3065996.1 uroporphyrinogen-III C-methyltransferase [Rhodoferax sp. U11-2br]